MSNKIFKNIFYFDNIYGISAKNKILNPKVLVYNTNKRKLIRDKMRIKRKKGQLNVFRQKRKEAREISKSKPRLNIRRGGPPRDSSFCFLPFNTIPLSLSLLFIETLLSLLCLSHSFLCRELLSLSLSCQHTLSLSLNTPLLSVYLPSSVSLFIFSLSVCFVFCFVTLLDQSTYITSELVLVRDTLRTEKDFFWAFDITHNVGFQS